MKGRSFFVYILGNGKGTLYVGVSNNLERRMHEHKKRLIQGFASKYALDQLLFFEEFPYINEAIEMEKRIKGWVRKKKLALIRTRNPQIRRSG